MIHTRAYSFNEEFRDAKLKDLGTIAKYLQGNHSNQVQADRSSEYPSVFYTFCKVIVAGSEYNADLFLYAEQNVSNGSYIRRSVYQFKLTDNKISVRSFKLKASTDQNSICKSDNQPTTLSPELIDFNSSNCEVFYRPTTSDSGGIANSTFVGRTPEGGCPSNYLGAVKLTVSERIQRGRLDIWEQWFDATGRQVAGSISGPYIYYPVR
jgi:hypothetical protein